MCPSVNGSVGFCHLINGIGIDASLVDEAGLVAVSYTHLTLPTSVYV